MRGVRRDLVKICGSRKGHGKTWCACGYVCVCVCPLFLWSVGNSVRTAWQPDGKTRSPSPGSRKSKIGKRKAMVKLVSRGSKGTKNPLGLRNYTKSDRPPGAMGTPISQEPKRKSNQGQAPLLSVTVCSCLGFPLKPPNPFRTRP